MRHQFHVVEIPRDANHHEGVLGARGTVRSWTHSGLGWLPASAEEDFPGHSGFGWKVSVAGLGAQIRDELRKEMVMSRDELFAFEPRLEYLTFDDLRRLRHDLQSGAPRVDVILEKDGRVREVSLVAEDPDAN